MRPLIIEQTYFGKAAEPVRYSFKYSPPKQRKKYFEDQGIEVKEFKQFY